MRGVPLAITTVVLLAIPVLHLDAAADGGVPQVPCLLPGLCPDLIVNQNLMRPSLATQTFSSSSAAVCEGSTVAGTRTLVRFTFSTPNIGIADLFVGDPSDHPEWFVFSTCHNHYHFRQYAAYRVWTPAAYASWDALRQANPGVNGFDILAAHPELQSGLTVTQKQGFCVIDIRLYSVGIPKYQSCGFQGISTGWADEYSTGLTGQFVDVTGLPHGNYVLEAEVNAHQLYEESNYDNDRSAVNITI
jgi:hypothetical protein